VDGVSGALALIGTVVGTPPATGAYVARWRSLVHTPSACFSSIVLRGTNTGILAALDYRPGGVLTFGSLTVGSWTQDVSQLFEVTIDLDSHVTSLSIDGIPVTAAQQLGFLSGNPQDVARIGMELGCVVGLDGTLPQAYAWDDVSIGRE
jgi:hypothetical protein